MMNDLRITLVQPDIRWMNPTENLNRFTASLGNLADATDLVCLPEMFQTGFCTNPEQVAETMQGNTVQWMKHMAETLHCSVAGSLVIRENRRFFNRIIYIDQYANLTWYDKRHLFRMDGEESGYTAGSSRMVVPLNGWLVYFQVCYDLRFPVWSRNQDDYDVLVNLASWPAARRDVWETLLRARAIENQSYAVGVNRVGTDGNAIAYTGNSLVVSPKGTVIVELPPGQEVVHTQLLSWEELSDFREKFPVWKDRDEFRLEV
jgi:predicted amidohydrolase